MDTKIIRKTKLFPSSTTIENLNDFIEEKVDVNVYQIPVGNGCMLAVEWSVEI